MNGIAKKLSMAMLATMSLVLASCGNDDNNVDEPIVPIPGSASNVNPATVFTCGLPSQVGNMMITTNDKGQVVKIKDSYETYTFIYGNEAQKAANRALNIPADYAMLINVTDSYDNDEYSFYIRLNEQGYITYAYEVYSDSDEQEADEWWFTYNADGRLSTMKRTEGNNEVTTITYTDGDITRVKMESDPEYPGDHNETDAAISYTDAAHPSPILNKSGIMLFDECFSIDMDEMAPAYFAGLLGKGTAHLPLASVEDETDPTYTTFTWELNSNNMPTKFKSVSNYHGHEYPGDELTFVW